MDFFFSTLTFKSKFILNINFSSPKFGSLYRYLSFGDDHQLGLMGEIKVQRHQTSQIAAGETGNSFSSKSFSFQIPKACKPKLLLHN